MNILFTRPVDSIPYYGIACSPWKTSPSDSENWTSFVPAHGRCPELGGVCVSNRERRRFPASLMEGNRVKKPLKKDVNDTMARGKGKEKVPAMTKNNVAALAHMGKRKKRAAK